MLVMPIFELLKKMGVKLVDVVSVNFKKLNSTTRNSTGD